MIDILSYEPIEKGSLKGKFNIRIPQFDNLIIEGMLHWKKENRQWCSFPSHTMTVQGAKAFYSDLKFEKQEDFRKFMGEVKDSLDEYLKREGKPIHF